MKKLKFGALAMLTLSLSLFSCSEEVTESTNDTALQKSEGDIANNCEFQPYALYFENGTSVDCANNMMHFSSWDSFDQTLETLEDSNDAHDDNFLAIYGHLDEDDLNDTEELIGHHPDQPLIDFENSHDFCSLRKFEEDAENAWLDSSDQSGWSIDDWNENEFIVDPVEQSVYNQWNEVMICNLIYKDMEGGLLIIDTTHPDATAALTSANNGNSLQSVLEAFGGNEETPGAADGHIFPPDSECFYRSAKSKGVTLSSTYKLRASHQMRARTFDSGSGDVNVFKAFTRNYKKKRGKWRKRRIRSSAKIYGELYSVDVSLNSNPNSSTPANICSFKDDIDKEGDYKKKRRSKVKKRAQHPSNLITGTAQNKLFSEHRQRPYYETITFEER
ncbi:hypothetical protein I5168_05110 [Nonlabens sp. SCSIO 43208]|uniref:hypothetical protein n=1 Tax=Nonlabens sp. SCSIO 43208 TaxID=2793009 RepID=UPI003D6B9384